MDEILDKRINKLIKDSDDVVEINIYRLEKELKYQAVYYHNYSNVLADLHECKNTMRSKIDSLERITYLKNKGKPPSEAYIESVIKNDKKLIKVQVLIEKLEGILKSLDHKKKALECLVQLELAGYYSEPKTNDNQHVSK